MAVHDNLTEQAMRILEEDKILVGAAAGGRRHSQGEVISHFVQFGQVLVDGCGFDYSDSR